MDRPTSKKILSVLVSVLGWILIIASVHSNLAIWYGVLRGELSPAGWLRRVLEYQAPAIVIGFLLLWSAAKLWARWRIGMGIVALFFGVYAARLAFVTVKFSDAGEDYVIRAVAFLLCETLVTLCVGIGCLLSQRKRDCLQRVSEGRSS